MFPPPQMPLTRQLPLNQPTVRDAACLHTGSSGGLPLSLPLHASLSEGMLDSLPFIQYLFYSSFQQLETSMLFISVSQETPK